MEAYFYNFVKKINSTKQPTASSAVSIPIEIKRDSSLLRPIILIKQTTLPNYNYMYIPEFERYYFLLNRTWQNGIWEIESRVDVLATYKFNIGNTSFYIARSSAKYDGNIIDLQYVTKSESVTEKIELNGIKYDDLMWGSLSTGYFVVGINGSYGVIAPQAGSITYLVLTMQQLYALMNSIFVQDLNWYKVQGEQLGISDPLAKMVFDPFEYVKSVRWLPFQPSCTYSEEPIKIGWWEFDPIGSIGYLNPAVVNTDMKELDVAIPKHPKSTARGNYLNTSRFSEYRMFCPSIGLVNINANDIINYSYLNFYLYIDQITGATRLHIYASKNVGERGDLYKIVDGIMGCDVNLTQDTLKFTDFIKHGLTAVGSMATLNPATIIGSIANFSDINIPTEESINGNTGFLGVREIDGKACLYYKYWDIVDEYNHDIGRPLCEVGTLENVGTGYYELIKPDLQISGTETESDEIITLLERGFFYE